MIVDLIEYDEKCCLTEKIVRQGELIVKLKNALYHTAHSCGQVCYDGMHYMGRENAERGLKAIPSLDQSGVPLVKNDDIFDGMTKGLIGLINLQRLQNALEAMGVKSPQKALDNPTRICIMHPQ